MDGYPPRLGIEILALLLIPRLAPGIAFLSGALRNWILHRPTERFRQPPYRDARHLVGLTQLHKWRARRSLQRSNRNDSRRYAPESIIRALFGAAYRVRRAFIRIFCLIGPMIYVY